MPIYWNYWGLRALSPVMQPNGFAPVEENYKMHALPLRTTCALVLVGLLAGSAAAIPVNIDTFDLGAAQGAAFGTSSTTGAEAIADTSQTIGGVRSYAMTGQGPGTGVTTLAVVGGRAGLGTLSIVAPYNGLWTLGYGYALNGSTNDLNADLVTSVGAPNTGILIKMISAEYAYDLDLSLITNGSGTTASLLLPANPNPHDVFVPFSSFSGVNFHDIDQISVQFRGRPDGDYVVDAIVASVPEPASMALLAIGGLLSLRRRR